MAIGPYLAYGSHLMQAETDNENWVLPDAGSVLCAVYRKPQPVGSVGRVRGDIGFNCLSP